MTRIAPLDPEGTDAPARDLLRTAEKKMGRVPNILKTMAHSPAALGFYLSSSAQLGTGTLSAKEREQIALATAGANACEYCASAHTALGKGLSIEEAELGRNLTGTSAEPRTAALLGFVGSVIESRGHVTDAQLESVRQAGYSDGQVAEIVANVALNAFTNFFNSVARPAIDFPRVEVGAAAR